MGWTHYRVYGVRLILEEFSDVETNFCELRHGDLELHACDRQIAMPNASHFVIYSGQLRCHPLLCSAFD